VALTLGSAAGSQSFTATAGSYSLSIPATAKVGDPAILAAVSGLGQVDTVTRTLQLPFTVLLTDKFNNPVPGVTVSWSRTKGSGTLAVATSVTGDNGQASSAYTLGRVTGVDSISASVSGVSNAIFTVQSIAGAAATVVATAGIQQTAPVLKALAPFVIKVTDAIGNPVAGRVVTWTATGGNLSPTTTTDTGGVTSNTMTLGQVAGSATATATIGPASVQFLVTVQSGVVAKLIFLTPPASTGPLAPLALKPIQVSLQDAYGNQTPSTNAVTIALGANPGGEAELGGTLTRNAVRGVATFDDLTLDVLAAGYTLVVSSANLPNLTSPPFNVTAGLSAIAPASIDGVFTTVPFLLSGTGFLAGGTSLAVTGSRVSLGSVVVLNPDSIASSYVIAGGGATTTQTITASTSFGQSNALTFEVGSVGGATLQVGPAEGGGGGTPYTIDCPAGSVGVGLNARGGVNVDNVQLICQTVTVSGSSRTFGAQTTTAFAGVGLGGSPSTLSCPAGMILVGLTGSLGAGGGPFNDAIGGVCQGLGGGATQSTGLAGTNNSGAIYQAICPAGLALTGIQGGAGDLVDRTQIRCR
jgi:hypothetical protein